MATNRLSENQTELLKLLRLKMISPTKTHTIQWPSDIEVKDLVLSESNKMVHFHLGHQAVISNMQTDASSFEAWAVIVAAWLGEGKYFQIEMSWDTPERFEKNDHRLHYQRFLYRVIRFREMFDWFVVSQELEEKLFYSQVLLPDGRSKGNLYLNSGAQNVRDRKNKHDGTVSKPNKAFSDLSEDCVEERFMSDSSSLMQCAFGSSDQVLKRQFPVGVFNGDGAVFPGRKSAIDLWAINNGQAAIFELKKPSGNKKVGIISELLFYANIVRDVQLGIFLHENPECFEEQLRDSSGVASYFLLGERNIHPLLNNNTIIDCLNDSGRKREIEFGLIYYNSSLKCRKENWGSFPEA